MMSNEEDIGLFNRMKEGDLQSFEILFRKYYSFLCSLAHTYVHDHDSAEEVVQDLFYRIWEKRGRINISSGVKPYLVRAVYFNSVNFRSNRRRDVVLDDRSLDTGPEGSDAEDAVKLEELNHLIETSLEELPEKGRQIFSLSRFEGLKYREIAERLSVSVKTVEAYMGQALKIFRKNMEEYMGR